MCIYPYIDMYIVKYVSHTSSALPSTKIRWQVGDDPIKLAQFHKTQTAPLLSVQNNA